MPVFEIDGRVINDKKVGEITKKLRENFKEIRTKWGIKVYDE